MYAQYNICLAYAEVTHVQNGALIACFADIHTKMLKLDQPFYALQCLYLASYFSN